ncbi:hypothetical protein [Gymnodinialimonas hymeniacidonis]|uniref:hypothetical protein n=1 Tax=Gymnodinialimonas hymeniacidonis TaxID=3126508 RepID=UPI0034C65ECB
MIGALIATLTLPAAADTYWPSESDIVTPTARGLSVASEDGTARAEIPFGTGFQDTMHGLIGIFGWEVDVTFPQECGAGPMVSADWPRDITLMFENDRFAGWFLGTGDLLSTDSGLWHGAPTSNLTTPGGVSFFESGLGTEFDSAGLYGLLTEDGARVEAIWTGVNCIFR